MLEPVAYSRQDEIRAAIEHAEQALRPDVVRIRYEIGLDWAGDWSTFFRVVLTDDAAKHRLLEAAKKVERELSRQLDYRVLGVYEYHNFRSESEQAELQEPAWA